MGNLWDSVQTLLELGILSFQVPVLAVHMTIKIETHQKSRLKYLLRTCIL